MSQHCLSSSWTLEPHYHEQVLHSIYLIWFVLTLLLCVPPQMMCEQPPTCKPEEFTCLKGNIECVPKVWQCDGIAECEDGSDEKGCPSCSPNHFTCRNGECINAKDRLVELHALRRLLNSMKLVILLHSLYWSIHTKDESKRGNRVCFHLWCELTLALWCHSIVWSLFSWNKM